MSQVADLPENWTVSKQLLNRLLAFGVNNSSIETGLGRAAFHSGDVQAAESHFRAAADLAPGEVVAGLLLAGLFASQQWLEEADAWFVIGMLENKLHSDNIRLAYAFWMLSQQRAPESATLPGFASVVVPT